MESKNSFKRKVGGLEQCFTHLGRKGNTKSLPKRYSVSIKKCKKKKL
jgi:hypothetical protein